MNRLFLLPTIGIFLFLIPFVGAFLYIIVLGLWWNRNHKAIIDYFKEGKLEEKIESFTPEETRIVQKLTVDKIYGLDQNKYDINEVDQKELEKGI